MHVPRRLSASLSPAAMTVAVSALVLAGAGAGYSAAQIGTKDIKNNAVTSAKIQKNAVTGAKVKNGSLTAADLVKEKKPTRFGAAGGPAFSNGGQGDCVWQSASVVLPGVGAPSYRVDRFGTVHLSGVAVGGNGAGGDATCDYNSEAEDGIVTILPAAVRPATIQVRPIGSSSEGMIIVGNTPIMGLPKGAVYWKGPPTFGALLDGISYLPAGSPLAARTATRSHLSPEGRVLLRHLGLG